MNLTEMHWRRLAFVGTLLAVLALAACAVAPTETVQAVTPLPEGTATLLPTPLDTSPPQPSATPTCTVTPAPTVIPTLAPDEWKTLPVVPTISDRTRQIYQTGLALGNDPKAFSKVGDCESRTTWFLWDFDQASNLYSLGSYTELEGVIDHYQGSFGRLSQVAKPGFTAASVMTSLWADKEQCQKDETPLACEYRQHKPSVALITLGTNDVSRPETFEQNLRMVIEYSIEKGVVPILATKADNLEGDHRINAVIAALAREYQIPLWNFWLAVQPLPDHGLQDDGVHLTFAMNQFGDPLAMRNAWPVRNLTALQVLDAFWKAVSEDEQ